MDPRELTLLVTGVANGLYDRMPALELAVWAAVFTQLGDTLDALLPGKPPVKIPVEDLRNGEGEPIQATPHATMAFSLPWEEPLPAGTILRFCSGKGIQP